MGRGDEGGVVVPAEPGAAFEVVEAETGFQFAKLDDAGAARAKELEGKGISASDIGKLLGVSRATVYRYLI